MTCQRIRFPDTTLYESKELAGVPHGGWLLGNHQFRQKGGRLVRMTPEEVAAQEDRQERERVLPGGDVWMCGSGEPEPQCPCGRIADLLCDYPMGRGKTCDAPMCPEHAFEIAEEKHLCLIHHAEFRGKAKVERINPWPPPGYRGAR